MAATAETAKMAVEGAAIVEVEAIEIAAGAAVRKTKWQGYRIWQ